jgi:uncharacterized membrane protein
MSGIYIGAWVTIVWLWASGRSRAARLPPSSVLLLLGAFVAVMAVDGFNALLFDLGARHPYTPRNALRLATGTFAGVALGVAVSHVCAAVVVNGVDRLRAVVERPTEAVPPLLIAFGLALPALSELAILHGPYSGGLAITVVAVFSTVAAAVLRVALAGTGVRPTVGKGAPVASLAVVLAVAMIGALAIARFAAERYLGLPNLT